VKIPDGLASGILSGKTSPDAAINELNASISGRFDGLLADAQAQGLEITQSISDGMDEGGEALITAYAELIAQQLKRDGKEPEIDDAFVSTIAVAAPLHDIGKINISDVILNKPGKLTDEEFAEMKKHTVYGRDMLVRASKNLGETAYLKMAKEIAYSHHEWWDGSRGYPERLKGKDIPLSARIMAVADVYDALVSVRPYKKAFSVDEAFRIITEESGTHFDPEVVDAFVKNRETVEQIMKTKFED
jgi:energy-coupling factor transport system substrate-specific component